MTDKCNQESCSELTRLEQQVDDIRRQNGADHKEFRIQLQEMEKESARQSERFDRIIDTLNDLKGDNKSVLEKLTPLTNKMDDIDRLTTDIDKLNSEVDEIKAKPGKKWEKVSMEVLLTVILAIVAFVLGKGGF